MKRSAFFGVLLLSAFSTVPCQAGIAWDSAFHQFRYALEENGGLFYIEDPFYLQNRQDTEDHTYDISQGITANFDDIAEGDLSQFDGAIQMKAMAMGPDGGENPTDGLLVQAYCEVLTDGLTESHGLDADQAAITYVTRRFCVDSEGEYKVIAALNGLIDFDAFDNGNNYAAAYSVSGEVSLTENTGSGDNTVSTNVPGFPLTLGEGTGSLDALAWLRPENDSKEEITYAITAKIEIESHLVNLSLPDIHGIFPDGDYKLGTESEPLTLQVNIGTDVDGDDVVEGLDNCPETANPDQTDTDEDTYGDACDSFPADAAEWEDTDGDGEGNNADPDDDGDGTLDAEDGCPLDALKTEPGVCGCGVADIDSDSDGTLDCNDQCPEDPSKTEPGLCGCGVEDSELDSDEDGTPDCIDGCPSDSDKIDPGSCGCGNPDTDTDGDGAADCVDGCPNDPYKKAPGTCGCGILDVDDDADGTLDCNDLCPQDPNKIEPGTCGCGAPDTDSDEDGTADCNDLCPQDPNKVEPGTCGCGTPDIDTDGDGVLNCLDKFPQDADYWEDSDDDGMPDPWETQYGLLLLTDDADEDADEDTWSNLEEFERNTDPTDPASHPGGAQPWLPLLLSRAGGSGAADDSKASVLMGFM